MRIAFDHHHDAKLDDVVELLTTSEGVSTLPSDALDAREVELGAERSTTKWVQNFEFGPADSPSRMISPLVRVEVSVNSAVTADRAVGNVSTTISGAPVDADACHVIEPDIDGCHSTLVLHLTTRVPMLGGRLLSVLERTATRQVEAYLSGIDQALSVMPG